MSNGTHRKQGQNWPQALSKTKNPSAIIKILDFLNAKIDCPNLDFKEACTTQDQTLNIISFQD